MQTRLVELSKGARGAAAVMHASPRPRADGAAYSRITEPSALLGLAPTILHVGGGASAASRLVELAELHVEDHLTVCTGHLNLQMVPLPVLYLAGLAWLERQHSAKNWACQAARCASASSKAPDIP
ncbi:hypothetical protein L1887_48245 [Cichorium endivia]|nr:hypothetical protein L1887_48245 [Cichorium endivia]